MKADSKCLIRERIDVEGEPRRSYMHKVWDDGTVEYYGIDAEAQLAGQSGTIECSEAEWLELCKTHPPQATYANSDWGSGLPGAGDIWKDIPAWKRG